MDVQCILLLSFIIDFSAWPIDRCERRRLEAHGDGVKHREAAHQLPLEKGQKKLASIPPSQLFTDHGLWIRLSSVHYLAVEDVTIHKFRSTIDLQLVNNGFSPSKHYHDDAAAWEMATIISQHQRKLLKERLAKSPYFGIMVDQGWKSVGSTPGIFGKREPSRPGTKGSDLGQHLRFSLCHGKGSSKVIIRRLAVTYRDYEYYEDKLNVTGYVKRNY